MGFGRTFRPTARFERVWLCDTLRLLYKVENNKADSMYINLTTGKIVVLKDKKGYILYDDFK